MRGVAFAKVSLDYDLGDITVQSTNPQQDVVLSTDQDVRRE
jgi:hypothetical protein